MAAARNGELDLVTQPVCGDAPGPEAARRWLEAQGVAAARVWAP
jgi:hypothetical protein